MSSHYTHPDPAVRALIAKAQAEALREAATAVATSVSYGFGMRPDGTEDPLASAYTEGQRDAWALLDERADRIEATR